MDGPLKDSFIMHIAENDFVRKAELFEATTISAKCSDSISALMRNIANRPSQSSGRTRHE